MILVVGSRVDDHVTAVGRHLDHSGAEWACLDLATLPTRSRISVRLPELSGTLRVEDRDVDLLDVRSVWLRRFASRTHHDLEGNARAWVDGEVQSLLAGLAQALSDVRWVNPLHVATLGDGGLNKVAQLEAAHACGLRVPRTLATNDPEAARAFASSVPLCVAKPFRPTWQPMPPLYAEIVTPEVAGDYACLGPVQLQERVSCAHSLRATVVGSRVFACRITASPDTLDYRREIHTAKHEAATLPKWVDAALVTLHERLQQPFGACDMIETPEGEFVFLESNQQGLWLWTEQRCGLPVSSAVASLLSREGM